MEDDFHKTLFKQPVFLKHFSYMKFSPGSSLFLTEHADVVSASWRYNHLHSIFKPRALRYCVNYVRSKHAYKQSARTFLIHNLFGNAKRIASIKFHLRLLDKSVREMCTNKLQYASIFFKQTYTQLLTFVHFIATNCLQKFSIRK